MKRFDVRAPDVRHCLSGVLLIVGLAAVLSGAGACVYSRSYEKPKLAPSTARDRGVAVHVTHEKDIGPGDELTDFDSAMTDALVHQLREAGLTPIAPQDVRDNDVILEVATLFEARDDTRARFTFYLRNAKAQEHSSQIVEAGVAKADVLAGLPRAAAIRIVNSLVSDTGNLVFLERQAAVRRASPAVAAAAKSGKSIFLTPLKATGKVSADTAHVITELLTARLSQHSALRVVTPDDVESALSAERQRDLVGCSAVSCMAEIGGALGTSYVGYGDIGTIGSQYVLTFVTVDSSSAQVVSRTSRALPRDDDQLAAAVDPFAAEIDAQWQSAGAH